MATLNVFAAFELLSSDQPLEGGVRSAPKQLTVDGRAKDVRKLLATATTWEVWQSGANEPITEFDLLWVESDQNIFVELCADVGGDVAKTVFAKEIQAGTPFLLVSDDALVNYTEGTLAGGTEDVIDRLRIRNDSGLNASVRVVLVT